MLPNIRELLFHPDTFFSGIELKGENMVIPVSIVALAAFIDIATYLIAFIPFMAGVPNVLGYSSLQVAFSLIIFWLIWVLFGTFVLWGILSAAFYALSRLLSGTGSFQATLQLVGYGMLPWTLSHLLTPLVLILGHSSPGVLDLLLINFSTPYGIINALFFTASVVMMIWTGSLWAYGIRHAHRLPLFKGVVIAVIMIIVYYVLTLVPTLLIFGLMGS